MNIEVKTRIDQVTVYPDRARVRREGECELQPGSCRLIIPGLPLALDPDSIRAGGEGEARVRLMGVDVAMRHYDQTPAEKVRELETAVDQLRDEIHRIEDKQAGWVSHQDYLHGLREATSEFAWGLSRGRTKVADQVELVRFLQEQDTTSRDALRTLDQEHREKKKRLDTLLQQLKQLQGARPRRRYEAAVDVEVLTAGLFLINLTYVVRRARWMPLYDVRLQEEEGAPRLLLSYQAEIAQETGEDWLDAALSVSTARPALNERLPELDPWYLDEWKPARPLMRAMAQPPEEEETGVLMNKMSMKPDLMAAPAPAEIAQATMQSSGTAVTYQLAGRGDIPADGSPRKASVGDYPFSPTIEFVTVPRHTDAVYRQVMVTNDTGGPLLPGPANLFAGEEFIGRTEIEYTAAGAEIELLLGVESRLSVSRELVRRDVDKKLLRDQRQLRYGYAIELKNHMAEPANITVHDQIPLAAHEKIKIKLNQVQPAPQEQSDMNMLEWFLTLSPNTTVKIQYEFTVEYPRDMRLRGLQD